MNEQPAMMIAHGGIRSLGRFYNDGSLGAVGARVRILVQDLSDRPFSGIRVRAGELTATPVEGVTNGNGTVVLDVPVSSESGVFIHIFAVLPEGEVKRTILASDASKEVVTFRSIEKAPQPIATTVEVSMVGVGIITFVVGRLIKTEIISDILTMLGEIGVIGAVFHRIGRGL